MVNPVYILFVIFCEQVTMVNSVFILFVTRFYNGIASFYIICNEVMQWYNQCLGRKCGSSLCSLLFSKKSVVKHFISVEKPCIIYDIGKLPYKTWKLNTFKLRYSVYIICQTEILFKKWLMQSWLIDASPLVKGAIPVKKYACKCCHLLRCGM